MAALREELAGTAQRAPEGLEQLWKRKRDIMIFVTIQVAIALVLVPIAEQANKIHLAMAISLATLLGMVEVFCFKPLWEALGFLARASRMVGANNDPGARA